MATRYKIPGVYIEELSKFPPSVAEVETAIPAFIGYTEKAEKNNVSLINVPTRITSLMEYEQYYGHADKETGISVNITDTYDIYGKITRVVTAPKPASKSRYLMYYSLQMYFSNGGDTCYIISVGNYSGGTPIKSDLGTNGGLAILEKEDEPTLIVFPDASGISTAADFYDLYKEALIQCNNLQDRFTIIDTFNQVSGFAETLRTNFNLDTNYLKYGAVYYPWLKTTLPYIYDDCDVSISHTEETPPSRTINYDACKLNDSEIVTNTELYKLIKLELGKLMVILPPSAAVAGIYVRVDRTRGVWKAPANIDVMQVLGPDKKVTNNEQENLNVHSTGKSINAIRSFSGKGTLIWGARTLAGNDNEWRYISVRRFFNMVKESVKKSAGWAVFEPNDANTWNKVQGMIEGYLYQKWQEGALQGAKPDNAFFVKVGLGLTMTQQDVLEGRMIVEIGMAVLRPAEFIIFKFTLQMIES